MLVLLIRSFNSLISFILSPTCLYSLLLSNPYSLPYFASRISALSWRVHTPEEAKQWLPENQSFRRYFFYGDELIVKGFEKKSCPRPWQSTLINWDGSLVPCCFDKNGHYVMGNINENSMQNIWHSSSFSDFRLQLLQNRSQVDICRNCNQGFGSFLPGKMIKNQEKKNT